MINISYSEFKGKNVDFLKPLVDALMTFQSESAKIHPEIMKNMNYNNRLKQEYKGSKNELILVAYLDQKPIGFAYGIVTEVTKDNLMTKPSWAENLSGIGFYPNDYDVPKTVGIFKLLYVKKKYRGYHIGKKLSDDIMTWFLSKNTQDLWVYVANGNEKVCELYEKLGFHFSHSVYDGFINAYIQEI
jgi:ribosomal protein S18 acetylase RimI-like enzyme